MPLPLGDENAFNGTTEVTVLAAPASAKQRVVPSNGLSFYNADTVACDVIVQKNKGGTRTVLYKKAALAAGDTDVMPKKVVLDATNESLEVKLGAGITTNQPTWDLAAVEYP